jgi:hypothetical protein
MEACGVMQACGVRAKIRVLNATFLSQEAKNRNDLLKVRLCAAT